MTTAEVIRESGSITLSMEARHALGLIVESNARTIGEEISRATTIDDLDPAVERAQQQLRAMRAIETGEITRKDAAQARSLVFALLDDLGTDIRAAREHREAFVEGDTGWSYPGMTRAENLAEYAKEIERHTQEASWCDAFLTEVAA